MPNPIGYQPQPYQANFSASLSAYASFASNPGYGGDPGTFGMSAGMAQQSQMMSIFMSMMQSQSALQAGFSQFLGQGYGLPNAGYQAPAPAYGAQPPTYGGASSYGGGGYGGGGYKPAPLPAYKPTPAPAPAPAPAPPAKKGGYA